MSVSIFITKNVLFPGVHDPGGECQDRGGDAAGQTKLQCSKYQVRIMGDRCFTRSASARRRGDDGFESRLNTVS